MNRFFLFAGVIFCIIFAALACERDMLWRSKPRVYSNSLATPEEVVKVFCDMDAAGKRLSSLSWSEMLPYISWREEVMESVAVVISGYKLSSIKKTENAADIVVVYEVIGKYWPEKIVSMKTIEKVSFAVNKTDAGWKINSPDTMLPHVLSKALIIHLERISKKESDMSTVKGIQNRIAALESLK